LNHQRLATQVTTDDFQRLAERAGADPTATKKLVEESVSRLRESWRGELLDEARARFAALAEHYEQRLSTLPICLAG
jgi:serine/threonine-protein kinase HipA